MQVLKVARAHIGATVLGIAVLGSGVGVATAVVVTPAASTDEVYETPATTEPATTTVPPAPVAPPEPVSDVVEPPADIVEPVTEPEQAPVADEPAPAPEAPTVAEAPAEPKPYDPMATWTDEAGNTWLPGPEAVPEKLPGEPGYVPPGD